MKAAILFLSVLFSAQLFAQGTATKVSFEKAFIAKWSNTAIVIKEENGIPASITIAQAMVESNCGRSELATQANNFFGIKAFGWDGEVYEKQDDEVGLSKFRVYSSPKACFEDRVEFLSKSRYEELYQLADTDYKGWAMGLLRCGYATDTAYAQKLINIIEAYHLYELDFEAANVVAAANSGYVLEGTQVVTEPTADSADTRVEAGRPVLTAAQSDNPPAAVRLNGDYSRGQKRLNNERGHRTTKKLNRKRSRSLRNLR